MNSIAIIPARGGSKRIPRKNIKLFFGTPIIVYSIRAAIESKLFDEIIVSTDDDEIAEIACKFGASVPFRRSLENSGDFATTASVIDEVLHRYAELNKYFINCCCIYPAAPFISSEKLIIGYESLIKNKFNTVFPLVEHRPPIQRALKIFEDKIQMYFPQNINIRSQDLEKSYYDAGQFYWINVDSFLKEKNIYTNNSGGIIIRTNECQDIDDIFDWELAELKFKLINKI